MPQRLCYLNAMLHYLFAGPRFIFILSPLVYLILGRSNVFGYLPGILAYGLPHVFLSTLVNSRVHGKHRHSFWNEVYEVVLAPYIFLPTALALDQPEVGQVQRNRKGLGYRRRAFRLANREAVRVPAVVNSDRYGDGLPSYVAGRGSAGRVDGQPGLGLL